MVRWDGLTVPECPEAETKTKTTNSLDPDRSIRLRAREAGSPGLILGGEGTDRIADIVGTVCNRHDHGAADLSRRPQMLDLVIKVRSTSVHVFETFALVSDDVARDAIKEHHADGCPDATRVCPGKIVDGGKVALASLLDLLVELLGSVGVGYGADGVFGLVHARVVFVWFLVVAVFQAIRLVLMLLVARVLGRIVVGNEDGVGVAGPVEARVLFPEERAHGDVPDTEAAVLFDEPSV